MKVVLLQHDCNKERQWNIPAACGRGDGPARAYSRAITHANARPRGEGGRGVVLPKGRLQCAMALPISSVIFLASPSTMMVLSR
jgi:hypothetical protein